MHNKSLVLWLVALLVLLLPACNFLTGVSPAPTRTPPPSPAVEVSPTRPSPSPPPPTQPLPTETLPPTSVPPTPTTVSLPTETPTLASAGGIQPTILEIHMATQSQGWAVGTLMDAYDHILRTADGGFTWEDVSPPLEGTATKATAFFLGTDNAWVVYTNADDEPLAASPSVWTTSDGGTTWNAGAPLPLSGMEELFSPGNFTFVNPSQGWLLIHVGVGMSHDYSEIFATQDGGQTWTRVADPTSPEVGGLMSLPITALAFADANWGWATKDNQATLPGAYFEQSTDGGISWEDVFPPAPAELDWYADGVACRSASPLFPAAQTGYLLFTCRDFIHDTPPQSFFYATADGGQSWRYTPLPAPAHQLLFITPQDGWAFGRRIFHTADGGQTWAFVKQVFWDGQFSFVDGSRGWAVARNATDIALVSTADGGATWQILQPIVPGE